jgi:amino acid adenylation domain-containing protein
LNTHSLYARLQVLGVALRLEGEQLSYKAPAGTVTPDLRADVRAARESLCGYIARLAKDNDRSLLDVLAARFAERGEATALSSGRESVSYAQLSRRADEVAARLQACGVRSESRVGILLDRSIDAIAAMIGVLRAGGAYVPLDRSYPSARLQQMLRGAGVELVISLDGLPNDVVFDGPVIALSEREQGEQNAPAILRPRSPDQLAYVMFTSGSHGQPKAVAVTDRGILRLVHEAGAIHYAESEVILHHSPLSFDASTFEIYGALAHGARLVVMPPGVIELDDLGAVIRRERVTTAWLTAGYFHAVMDEAPQTLTPLQQLIVGGDVVSPQRVNSLLDLCAGGLRLINGYGPTENTTFTCCHVVAEAIAPGGAVPIGQPVPQTSVYVLDEELEPVAAGVAGELYTGGSGLARGYMNDAALTAERFVPDPWGAPGARLYRTGDLVRWRADGQIEFLRRVDQQVKVRGHRIEVGEIESVLREHPGVRDAVVCAQAEPGGADKRLTAYILGTTDAAWGAPASQQIEDWQQLYEGLYEQVDTDDFVGWNSSYTDAPIERSQMQAWLEEVTRRILALRPHHVLEIGCGTGLLLKQLLPYCASYTGTDFSASVVRRLEAALCRERRPDNVSLQVRVADDLDGLSDGTFDTVILNSVTQYFPGLEYLRTVLREALRVLQPGGRIFVGDVRNYALLETFHGAVTFHKATPTMSVRSLHQVLDRRLEQEKELAIDPDFFLLLQQEGLCQDVEVTPRWEGYDNELSRYRYDVVLHKGPTTVASVSSIVWHDVSTSAFEPESWQEILGGASELIAITGIPHPLLQTDLALKERLAHVMPQASAHSLQGATPPDTTLTHLIHLAQQAQRKMRVSWLRSGSKGTITLVLGPKEGPAPPHVSRCLEPLPSYARYANNPLRIEQTLALTTALRQHLGQRLPEYMIPGEITVLPEFPLTANGKVDRQTLKSRPAQSASGQHVPARTALEKQLVSIWEDVLGVAPIGIHDNFFDLGGHSLLATQVASRARRMSLGASVRDLFAYPTIEQLALRIAFEKGDRTILTSPITATSAVSAPLSFAQERLWFLQQFPESRVAYNIPLALRLRGRIDVERLFASYREIVARHDVLRTVFAMDASHGPVQRIQDAESSKTDFVDLEGGSGDSLDALLRQERLHVFDLEAGPLVRCSLIRLAENDHVLSLNVHHIVCDGWSLSILLNELFQLYESDIERAGSALPRPTLQYRDYARWQRIALEGKELERQLAYWQGYLASAPERLSLPTDRPRAAQRTYNGAMEWFSLSEETSRALDEFSRDRNASPYMTLLTAFMALLYRYSGQQDILVGTPIANRNHSDTEGLIGFFVNTLVLRAAVTDADTTDGLLDRIRLDTLAAFENQDAPFEQVVERVAPRRSLSHSPLFQTFFSFQNTPRPTAGISGIEVSVQPQYGTTAKFDLTMDLAHASNGIGGYVEYNTDLFDAETIRRLIGSFNILLSGMLAEPSRPISSISMLSPRELSEAEGPLRSCLIPIADPLLLLFAQCAAAAPNDVAVVCRDQITTYAELERMVGEMTCALTQREIGAGKLVAVGVDRSAQMIALLLAIFGRGAAYVALDDRSPPERSRDILRDAGVTMAVVARTMKSVADGTDCVALTIEELLDSQSEVTCSEFTLGCPDDLAYVMYTSGSTGTPKGVEVTHRSVSNCLASLANRLEIVRRDRWLAATPLTFDISVLEIFCPLVVGGSVLLATAEDARDPAHLRHLVERWSPTIMQGTPALWHMLLEAGWSGAEGLRMLCGGEAWPVDLARALLERGETLWNVYGPTEATIWCSARRIAASDAEILIGDPLDNVQLYCLDSELHPVPVGVVGELYIGGEGLCRGYLGRPDLTAERFLPNPFAHESGQRIYRSGDLVRRRVDGIEFLGRKDEQVKIRGFRIELGEIEAALGRHSCVAQVAAAAVAREGNQHREIVAYVVTSGDVSAATLRMFAASHLPDYMIPSIVLMDALPLTSNGKVDRRRLPSPELSVVESDEESVPRTAAEAAVTDVWKDVLGVDRIGLDTSFFDLGGHSLLATQVVSRLREMYAVEVPVKTFFEAGTVRGVARAIEQARRESEGFHLPPIVRSTRSGPVRMSYAQERLWFIDRLDRDSTAYNVALGIRLIGTLDVGSLHRAFVALVSRQESLRTIFVLHDGVPHQVVLPSIEFELPVVDLSAEPATELQRRSREHAEWRFDLEKGPLLRAELLRVSATEHVLLINMHHIVTDGWSMGVFLQELAAFYESMISGKSALVAELPVQYSDYAMWQRSWLQGEVLARQVAYWREQLAGIPALLELPLDHPRPPMQSYHGGAISFHLDIATTHALRGLARRCGVTMYMLLLAGFQSLLFRYTGQQDIVVGSPIANRNCTEIEQLVGFFVNTLVLRARFSGNPAFRDFLQQVRRTAVEAYAHQDLPFERLVDEIKPERALSHHPVFQALFVLQNAPRSHFALPNLELSLVPTEIVTAKFDLGMSLTESDEGIHGMMEYNSDLLDATTIERMVRHYGTLLASVVDNPDCRISEIPLLSMEERQQLLVEWNDTAKDYPRDACLHHLFEAQAQRTPTATALVFGDLTLSYEELDDRSSRLAHHLRSLGVGPEVPVALCAERSPDMIVAILAILKAGGAYVPIDVATPSPRVQAMVSTCRSSLAVADRAGAARLPAGMSIVDLESLHLDRMPATWVSSHVSPANLAYLIHTSGSTGTPKGVAIAHQNAVAFIHWCIDQFEHAALRRVLGSTSVTFDLSIFEMFSPWAVGGAVVLVRNAMSLVNEPIDLDISLVNTVPSALEALVVNSAIPLGVRTINCAGEPLKTTLVEALLQQRPDVRVNDLYGPSEYTTYASFASRSASTAETIGVPIGNTSIYILDEELQPVPIGVLGEIYIGGLGLSRGYMHQPGDTAERFLPNPFGSEGERFYRTGDLATFSADGNILFAGRRDHQVKIRGFRIELGDIEHALLGTGLVREGAVICRTGRSFERRIVAYVAFAEGNSEAELRSALAALLPAYMLPSAIVSVEALPRTPTGKVDRRRLERTRDFELLSGGQHIVPRTVVEAQLHDAWMVVLDDASFGVTDNFFDAGGNSLLAVKLLEAVRRITNFDAKLVDVFRYPTIEAFASWMAHAESDGAAAEARVRGDQRRESIARASSMVSRARRATSGQPQ